MQFIKNNITIKYFIYKILCIFNTLLKYFCKNSKKNHFQKRLARGCSANANNFRQAGEIYKHKTANKLYQPCKGLNLNNL